MNLNTENFGKYGATRQSWSRDGIRAIYAELKGKHPKSTHSQMVKLLAERMEEDEEARTAAADYIVAACEQAQFGYEKRTSAKPRHLSTMQNLEATRQRVAAAKQSIKDKVKEHIEQQVIFLLNTPLSNGKLLKDSTYGECTEMGGALSLIGSKGKPHEIVGKTANDAKLRKWQAAA
jgi:hypothetical protein